MGYGDVKCWFRSFIYVKIIKLVENIMKIIDLWNGFELLS